MQLNKSSLSIKRFFNGTFDIDGLKYDIKAVYLLIGHTSTQHNKNQ